MEVSALEPIWEFFPKPDKTFMQRYGFYVYELLVIPIGMFIEVIKRMCHNYTGELRLRPENLLPVVELIVMILFAESVGMAVRYVNIFTHYCTNIFLDFQSI